MFHELTDNDIKRRREAHRRHRMPGGGARPRRLRRIQRRTGAARKTQGAVALRDSILASAKQCCAIEGSYPSSLEHLEESYGLTINHDDYVITYECFADNVMPSVVVTPR